MAKISPALEDRIILHKIQKNQLFFRVEKFSRHEFISKVLIHGVRNGYVHCSWNNVEYIGTVTLEDLISEEEAILRVLSNKAKWKIPSSSSHEEKDFVIGQNIFNKIVIPPK